MGFWSSNLYGNDTTCDVRDSYIQFLEMGDSNAEAYAKLIEAFKELIGDQDEPLLWLSLADTQWRLGRLIPEVKEKALFWIENGGALELWDGSPKGNIGWQKTLLKLKEKLVSPMPRERKISKLSEINQNPWNLNDVYAFQFHCKNSIEAGYFGKYIIIQKIGEDCERYHSPVMRIQVLDRVFDTLPTIEDMEDLRILPLDMPGRSGMNDELYHGKRAGINMNCTITLVMPRMFPKKYLTFLGNCQGPANKKPAFHELAWENIGYLLIFYHKLWQGIDYETIGDGLYYFEQDDYILPDQSGV